MPIDSTSTLYSGCFSSLKETFGHTNMLCVLVHTWFYAAFSWVGWVLCVCGFICLGFPLRFSNNHQEKISLTSLFIHLITLTKSSWRQLASLNDLDDWPECTIPKFANAQTQE